MENVKDRNEVLEFPFERWLDEDQDDGDVVREAAARWPDETPLKGESEW